MLIGTRHLGAVDRVDHECIKTRFWGVVVPLVPLGSVYVLNAQLPSIDGLEVPLHWRSVLAAYMRTLALVALLAAGAALLETWDPQWWGAFIGAALVLAAAHLAIGRLSSDEKHRRRLLRYATGIGAPPELMRHAMRRQVLRSLQARWRQRFPEQPWTCRAEASDIAEDELVLLHALAELCHQPLLARELRKRWRSSTPRAGPVS